MLTTLSPRACCRYAQQLQQLAGHLLLLPITPLSPTINVPGPLIYPPHNSLQ